LRKNSDTALGDAADMKKPAAAADGCV